MVATDEAKPRCCLDTSCSRFSVGLAIDTSHVCVLARAATALANGKPVSVRFGELLGAHRCAGSHVLLTSQAMCAKELDLYGNAPPLDFADLPADSLEMIECVDETLLTPLAAPATVRDRDLTLVTVADSRAGDGMVMLLTDDEDMVTGVREMATGMSDDEVAVWPKFSIEFLGELHACGAILLETLITAAGAEEDYAQIRLTDPLLTRKLTRIEDTLNEAVIREASHGST